MPLLPVPSGPYTARTIRFHDVRKHKGWLLKLYTVSETDPPTAAIPSGMSVIYEDIDEFGVEDTLTHGIGFVIIHRTAETDYLLYCVWRDGNVLQFTAWHKPVNSDKWQFRKADGTVNVCTWDLHVVAFERKLWLDKVLRNRGGDVEGYLREHINQTV